DLLSSAASLGRPRAPPPRCLRHTQKRFEFCSTKACGGSVSSGFPSAPWRRATELQPVRRELRTAASPDKSNNYGDLRARFPLHPSTSLRVFEADRKSVV